MQLAVRRPVHNQRRALDVQFLEDNTHIAYQNHEAVVICKIFLSISSDEVSLTTTYSSGRKVSTQVCDKKNSGDRHFVLILKIYRVLEKTIKLKLS